ncbi:DUF402 domain-containing protein [Streptomyces goshikiensis]|uniref:DUF402 domain-containing protein n=1 Tax=Streptomyces goshikiensis TaxID=1942 RepID=UPI0022F380F0|nr:DUF402 domain-containing protein [Streptomyces goshikiensis]WBY24802.1 DUF402 domain-containing protein [Streptomyces goshikiensis]
MRGFETGQTVVRRDVHRWGRVWSEQALRVVADTGEALVTACAPGAQARWPALYAKARTDRDRSVRTEAFEALASGRWDLAVGVWEETDLLLWKPPVAWFSINAFYVPDGNGRRLRNWYVNFERPTRRTPAGFDTFDLTVDLVVSPDLTRWEWKDEDEYAHVRRLGIVSDTEHQAVDAARGQVLAMLAERSGVFAHAERWAAWRWEPAWPTPCLPGPVPTAGRVAPEGAAKVLARLLAAGDRRCDQEWEPDKTDTPPLCLVSTAGQACPRRRHLVTHAVAVRERSPSLPGPATTTRR